MWPDDSVHLFACLTCNAPIGEWCRIARRDGSTKGVHYTRWCRAIGENHDPGDEDRS